MPDNVSTRDDLEKFITPEGRAKVDTFMAEAAGESDDVDMDEAIRQNLADHEAALTGRRTEAKKPKPLKPRTGYIVVRPGWDPAASPTDGWTLMTLTEARQYQAQSKRLKCDRTDIVQVTIAYKRVEGGDSA